MSYSRGPRSYGAGGDLLHGTATSHRLGASWGRRDAYLYPEDYWHESTSDRVGVATVGGWVATLKQVRRHGTVDGRPGSKAIKQMLATIDNGLVAEAMRLDGVSADDDH